MSTIARRRSDSERLVANLIAITALPDRLPDSRQIAMLVHGILNPQISSLLARTRHTNTLVIADRGFPFWPGLETIDLSLVDGIPTVSQVVAAVLANWKAGCVFMAEEFYATNDDATQKRFLAALHGVRVAREPHQQFKLRVPHAIGLIRTGETIPYANLILESA